MRWLHCWVHCLSLIAANFACSKAASPGFGKLSMAFTASFEVDRRAPLIHRAAARCIFCSFLMAFYFLSAGHHISFLQCWNSNLASYREIALGIYHYCEGEPSVIWALLSPWGDEG